MAFATETLNYIKRVMHNTSVKACNDSGKDNSGDIDSGSNDDESGYTPSKYLGVLDTDLTALTPGVRIAFTVTVSLLFAMSMCGNIGTLLVNFRRKLRPFFRACLISLAVSDLLNTVFLSVAYLAQFSGTYVQIWLLGPLMCNLVPYITTAAILASSMTLVGIALDRYLAIMKVVITFWNPGVIFCVCCILAIWSASLSISIPVFRVYSLYPVYVLTEESKPSIENSVIDEGSGSASDNVNADGVAGSSTERGGGDSMIMDSILTNEPQVVSDAGTILSRLIRKFPIDNQLVTTTTTATDLSNMPKVTRTPWEVQASQENFSYTLVKEQELVMMCISNQRDIATYYIIVFAIIFVPCIIAFIGLNAIIAKKLWIRRHGASVRKPCKKSTFKKSPQKCTKTTPQPINHKSTNHTSRISFKCAPRAPACSSSTTTMPSSVAATLGASPNSQQTGQQKSLSPHKNQHSNRYSRHLRMFTIVLLLIAVFLFLRLPAWIFLIMRMYGTYSRSPHWIIYFCFGILHLCSCVLNPLFYTFLAETIQCATCLRSRICVDCFGLRLCCKPYRERRLQLPICVSPDYGGCGNSEVPKEQPKMRFWWLDCCNGWDWLNRAKLSCQPKGQERPEGEAGPQWRASVVRKVEDIEMAENSTDNDEGVDCSDLSDDEGSLSDFNIYNQRIFTIFPPELVSSSIASDGQN